MVTLTVNDLRRAWYLQQLGLTEQSAALKDVLQGQFDGSAPNSNMELLDQFQGLVTSNPNNTTAETPLWTPKLIPLSKIDAAKSVFRLRLWMDEDGGASSGTNSLRIRMANGVIVGTQVCMVNLTSGLTNLPFYAELDIYPTNISTSGLFTSALTLSCPTSATGAIGARDSMLVDSSFNFQSQGGMQFTVFNFFSIASVSNVCRLYKAQLLKVA